MAILRQEAEEVFYLWEIPMCPEAEKKLKKIKQSSRVLRRVCQGLLVITVLVGVIAVAASLIGRGGVVSAFDISIPLGALTVYQRLILATILAFAVGVLLKGLYHLNRLFGNYASGDLFTTENAGMIRQLGITALLWAGANVIWIAVTPVLMGTQSPHSFHFHNDSIAIGLVVIVISWLMEMAAALREENELTI